MSNIDRTLALAKCNRDWIKCPFLAAVCLCVYLTGYRAGFAQDSLPKYQPIETDGEVYPEGAWQTFRSEGITVAYRELKLVPKREPRPALTVRLLPDEYEAVSGNAAFFYLQALAGAEQSAAKLRRESFEREYREKAEQEGLTPSDVPPHVWRENTRPEDLPLEEVKQYLTYSSYQKRFLKEAWRRPHCDFDRRIREVEHPAMVLLPEIQAFRDLARTQSLRFLAAIAEDRTVDAVSIFGQQLAFAQHLSQEPFIVSNLVGLACASIGIGDAAYLCEHPGAPNLYWAIAALPQPLVNMRPALAFERQFLFEEFKLLKEIDTTPKSNEFLRESIDALAESLKYLAEDDTFSRFGELGTSLAVASSVPGARRYLIEVEGIDSDTLDGLPSTQVFLLGLKRYYENARDEVFKWQYVPYARGQKHEGNPLEAIVQDVREFGLMAAPTGAVLKGIHAARSAQARLQQSLALLQTIESIRHHLAENDNELPASLDDLVLPAVDDPATGEPLRYVRHSEGASLFGAPWTGYRVHYELRTTP